MYVLHESLSNNSYMYICIFYMNLHLVHKSNAYKFYFYTSLLQDLNALKQKLAFDSPKLLYALFKNYMILHFNFS